MMSSGKDLVLMYRIEYSKRISKQISKLDKNTQMNILKWIEKNLLGTDNPRLHGKPLVGNLNGMWRYRIGDYRLLAEIHDDELLILAIEIDHRREIYR